MEELGRESIMSAVRDNSDVLDDYGVKRLGLFGSFLRGEADSDSDLDFLVVFEENNFDNYMGLKLFLEDLFGRDVDLVIESDIREELSHVKRDAEYVTTA